MHSNFDIHTQATIFTWGGKFSQVPIFFLMQDKEGERLQLEGEGGVMKDLHAVVEHLLCHTCMHKKKLNLL